MIFLCDGWTLKFLGRNFFRKEYQYKKIFLLSPVEKFGTQWSTFFSWALFFYTEKHKSMYRTCMYMFQNMFLLG
jgi:hypothetical protein